MSYYGKTISEAASPPEPANHSAAEDENDDIDSDFDSSSNDSSFILSAESQSSESS